MTIAITTDQAHIDAKISPVFCQTNYFLIIDLTNHQNKCETILNPHQNMLNGADIFCAQLVISKGVDAVATGYCNPNAFRILQEAGIIIFENDYTTARDIIRAYKNNQLTPSKKPPKINR